MEAFVPTLALSIIAVMGGVFLLSIGWLLTGKSKIQPGACGRNPTAKDCGNKISCQLCDEKGDGATDKEEVKKNDPL